MAIKKRYYLIACGTSDYSQLQSDEYEQLQDVKKEIDLIVKLLDDEFGYKRALPSLYVNPKDEKEIRKQFATWLRDEERQKTDIVIFYYSGHGTNIRGDGHYLLLADTDPEDIQLTALATKSLVSLLNHKKIRISQILYIIDTCYSQGGAEDIIQFFARAVSSFEKVEGKSNIDLHVIAACRTKQRAVLGEFTSALSKSIEEINSDPILSDFLDPNFLVERINKNIKSTTQNVKYNAVACEKAPKFFPLISKIARDWEKHRLRVIEELVIILRKNIQQSIKAINWLFLTLKNDWNDSEFEEDIKNKILQLDTKYIKFYNRLILNEQDIKEILDDLSKNDLIEKICPLFAFAEWYRKIFNEIEFSNIAQEIGNWQWENIAKRQGADIGKTQEFVKKIFEKFQSICNYQERSRIFVEIEPEIDANGTGLTTGMFFISVYFQVPSQVSRLGLLTEKKNLNLTNTICLNEEEFVRCWQIDLIEAIIGKVFNPLNLDIEFLIPFELFSAPVDKLTFKSENKEKPIIGEEYPIFINSYERYYNPDYQEIRDNLRLKREEFWHEAEELAEDKFYFSGSQVPTEDDLLEIEENHSIAIWTRNEDHSIELDNDLKRSEWKEWPQKIQQLREHNKDLEITLFWDDMFPKPRPKKLFNTDLVE